MRSNFTLQQLRSKLDARVPPGEAHASAAAAVVSEDPRGDDLAEGLQHVVQLLLVHGQRQVGNVQVCGVLLLLLLTFQESKKGNSVLQCVLTCTRHIYKGVHIVCHLPVAHRYFLTTERADLFFCLLLCRLGFEAQPKYI